MNFTQNPRNRFLLLSTSVILGVLAVVGVVSAATTIGTSIQTDGNISVTGTTTMLGNIVVGKSTGRAPLDFYNENGPGDGWNSADGTGILFTGGIVQMDGVEDFTAGAHGWCSAGNCGLAGGESGGPLMRGEANRWQLAPLGAYYVIDIGSSYPVRAITWGTYWKDSMASQFTAYNIDYSTDGVSWTNAVTVTNNTKSVVLHYFSPTISARYWRITNNGNTSGYISNIQILGYTIENQYSNQEWGRVLSAWGGGAPNDNIVFRGVGNVGIGTSTEPYKLTVDNGGSYNFSSNQTIASFQNSVSGATSTTARIVFSDNDSSNITRPVAGVGGVITSLNTTNYQGALAFYTANNAAPSEVGRFDNNGNFGIATTSPWRSFAVNGTMAANGLTTATQGNYLCLNTTTKEITSGTTCTLSSERFKQNITDLSAPSTLPNASSTYPTSALAEVLALHPVSFTFKPGYGDNGSTTQLGFIAEQAVTVDPRLVPIDSEGKPAGFFYQNYTAVLTKAIQEQQSEINSLSGGTVGGETASGSTTPLIWHDTSSPLNTLQYDAQQIVEGVSHFSEILTDKVTATLGIFQHVQTGDIQVQNNICIGQTCVTESQLKTLLANSTGGQNQTSSSSNSSVISTTTSATTTPNTASSTTPISN